MEKDPFTGVTDAATMEIIIMEKNMEMELLTLVQEGVMKENGWTASSMAMECYMKDKQRLSKKEYGNKEVLIDNSDHNNMTSFKVLTAVV